MNNRTMLFTLLTRGTLLLCLAVCILCVVVVDGRGQSKPRSSKFAYKDLTGQNATADNETDMGLPTTVTDRRVRKRSKWQTTSYLGKEGSILKRIVTEVIAERDAQIAAALFEVAKNQPHLQMMVQTLGELSQSNQRLELSLTRLDDTQRRLDGRIGVISEKMTLLESRLSQTERRIEREMTHVHGKMDDFLRGVNIPDKSSESFIRIVKDFQDQLTTIEELVLDGQTSNKIRSKSRHSSKTGHLSMNDLQKVSNSLSQALAAAHNDMVRVMREVENNVDHQLSMLANDNGVFSCAISRLLEITRPEVNATTVQGNSLPSADFSIDTLATNATRCILKCP